jgi:diguanylate cyclase (GGDEF)-like protein
VAGLPSGDRPAQSADGPIEGQEGRTAPEPGATVDAPARAARGQTVLSHEVGECPVQQRARAAEHRRDAARNREEAARLRQESAIGRESLARRVPIWETDSLTGARTRDAGLNQLAEELDRCRRTSVPLVVVSVVAVGRQSLRDGEGDVAADELLVRIARITRDHVRSYDVICRNDSDEFLCAMSDVTVSEARERFVTIAAALADAPGGGTISTGFAELARHETTADLIASARRTAVGSSPHGPHQAHLVLLPEGRGEGRPAANPGPPSPDWPGEAAGQS